MDRFEAMRTLVAAIDGGSLSAASRTLNIPLSTVSRRVSDLEAMLRSQLVVRTSRKLLLTESGTAYVASARRVLEELAEAERSASGEYRAPRGELLVTAPILFGTLIVAPIVHDFLNAYPEVTVRLVLSDNVIDLVENRVDVAIRMGRLPDSALVARRAGEIRWVVCASPDYLSTRGQPGKPAELAGHDCIAFEGLQRYREWPFVDAGGKALQVTIDGLNIAYREAGDPRSPKLVLLHGWPSSSHQYRNLIPALAGRFHVIAPDYQGFGNSDHPDPATYHYSFDAISVTIEKFLAAKGFDHYGLFMQDYGGPVGFRIAGRNPKALDWLIIQNSNAYENGFSPAWDGFRKALWVDRTAANEAPLAGFNTLDAIKNTVYLGGAGHPELIAPESCESDAASVAGPKNLRIQLDLFYDYRTNVALYPTWQKFLRDQQPKTLIFWGQNDVFFTPEGGESYLNDLPKAEIHRLNAGHFATEDNLPFIASHILSFYDAHVKPKK